MRGKPLAAVLAAGLLAMPAVGADWPQYLGPHRNSTSDETGIFRSWPEGGPEVLWSVPVGRGFGGPAIANGRVYLLDRDDRVGDNLRCFDLATGKELWNFQYEAPGTVMFPGSRSVPTVDGDRIYTCGHNGHLHCLDLNTHQVIWKANVWTDFGGEPLREGGGFRRGGGPAAFPMWGITQCPLVYGDLLIVASQAPEAGVVAYDKLTGRVVWKTPSLGYVGYASPSIVKIDGRDHVVMVTPSTNPFLRSSPDENKPGSIVGIDPKTGAILWRYDQWRCHVQVPCAVDAGENRVLVVGGYELGATMIRVERGPDGRYVARELFTTKEFGGHTKPPILCNGHFYAQYGTNSRRDGLVCMTMDGRILWKTKRSPNFNKGSMILVDGLLLATDGETKLYLIEPDPAGFKPLASAELLGKGAAETSGIGARVGGPTQNWAPIALSNGRLLIRDQREMKCLRVGKGS